LVTCVGSQLDENHAKIIRILKRNGIEEEKLK